MCPAPGSSVNFDPGSVACICRMAAGMVPSFSPARNSSGLVTVLAAEQKSWSARVDARLSICENASTWSLCRPPGERTKLASEVVKPGGAARQQEGSSLDAAGLVVHAHDLISLGVNSNGMDVLVLKILNKTHSRSLVLDQERVAIARMLPTLTWHYRKMRPCID